MNRIFFVFVLAALAGAGCLKREEFPDEPQIEYSGFNIGPDTASLVLSFTDGDGNFGLKDGEYEGENYDCIKFYNAFLDYYELVNGEWILYDLNPCNNPNAVPFYYRVPYVEPSGQFKAQKGEIRIDMESWYLPTANDTFRFQVHVVDFDQNNSNVVTTPSYLKPS